LERLAEFDFREVLRMPNIGRLTAYEIENFLKQHGLSFADNPLGADRGRIFKLARDCGLRLRQDRCDRPGPRMFHLVELLSGAEVGTYSSLKEVERVIERYQREIAAKDDAAGEGHID
jgi:hypothetical protein